MSGVIYVYVISFDFIFLKKDYGYIDMYKYGVCLFFLNLFVLILKCCCVYVYVVVFICELYIVYMYNFICILIFYNIFVLESYWLLLVVWGFKILLCEFNKFFF